MGAYALVKRYPFLLLGIATFGLFLATGLVSDAAKTSELGRIVVTVLRVLIIPLWLMRDLEMLLGLGNWPGPVDLVIGFPLLFAPYVLADYLLYRARTTLPSLLRSRSHAT
jgi:hypothetical protein